MTDWRHTTTERLWLDQPAAADVDGLYEIHADPDNWSHFPQGRHQHRDRTAEMIGVGERQFRGHGLGYWSVRDAAGGPVVGCAGCAVADDLSWWNLYYRFAASVHGRGYAVEAARQAMAAAADVDPARPVLAYLLEHNVASRRTAERLGLRLVWRGPDAGNADAAATRLVYLDREPDTALIAVLAAQGMPEDGIV